MAMAKKFNISINTKNCKQCGICSYLCPKEVLEQKVGGYPEAVRPEACIGCRLCEMRCPDFAIGVEVVQE